MVERRFVVLLFGPGVRDVEPDMIVKGREKQRSAMRQDGRESSVWQE